MNTFFVWAKAGGDKREPNYYQAKKEDKPTLTDKNFADGEKVCFAWGERDSFHDSKVNEIYKYSKDILTPIVKRKEKIDKEGDYFVSDDGATDISLNPYCHPRFLTSDFKKTDSDNSKEYYAYTVTRHSESDTVIESLFYVEA